MKKDSLTAIVAFIVLLTMCITYTESVTYTSREPIHIKGNDDFTRVNGVVRGTGTKSDPYVIEGWSINVQDSDDAIHVENTDRYFIIKNCKIHNGDITLNHVVHGNIENLTISGSGISLRDSSHIQVLNNMLENTGCNGIEVNRSSDNIISQNTIKSGSCYGIELSYANNNKISDNSISGFWTGIIIWGSSNNNWIAGNVIEKNSDYGIALWGGAEHNTLRNNTMAANEDGGLSIQSYNNSIDTSNTINGKPVYYFYKIQDQIIENLDTTHLTIAESSNITIRNNTISSGDGIYLAYVNNSTITNNLMQKNAQWGLHLHRSSDNIISDNEIVFNNGWGLGLHYSTNNHIEENNISDNRGAGIYDYDTYHMENPGNRIVGNTIGNNKRDGVLCWGSPGDEIMSNTISNNGGAAVRLYGSWKTNISENLMDDNNRGIVIESSDFYGEAASNRIYHNSIVRSKEEGIYIYGASKNEIIENVIVNSQVGIHVKYLKEDDSSKFYSTNNRFWRNNLVSNEKSAFDEGSNQWDDGSHGNYWSDYEGVDSNGDGIGDAPYFIPGASNKDRYPLIQPFSGAGVQQLLNKAPLAIFTFSPREPYTGDIVTFNASDSVDPDGFITQYLWDFNSDGIFDASDAKVTYDFSTPGYYPVTLKVIDNRSASASTSQTVYVQERQVNKPPVVSFSYSPIEPTDLDTIHFTDESTDPDGEIIQWHWDFGDGDTSTLQDPSHRYADDGTYIVSLTVTDDDGATGTASKTITVSNVPPEAEFTFSPEKPLVGQSVTFDASASSDPDGSIVNYEWDFGDGTGKNYGMIVTHTFTKEGAYIVKLMVTDDDGVTDSIEKQIEVLKSGGGGGPA